MQWLIYKQSLTRSDAKFAVIQFRAQDEQISQFLSTHNCLTSMSRDACDSFVPSERSGETPIGKIAVKSGVEFALRFGSQPANNPRCHPAPITPTTFTTPCQNEAPNLDLHHSPPAPFRTKPPRQGRP